MQSILTFLSAIMSQVTKNQHIAFVLDQWASHNANRLRRDSLAHEGAGTSFSRWIQLGAVVGLFALSGLPQAQAMDDFPYSWEITQTYVIVNDGTSSYLAGGINGDAASGFANSNFGNFYTDGSLTLEGGEIKTNKAGDGNVCGGNLHYRVYETGSTPGSFNSVALAFAADLGEGNQKWDNTTANIELLQGLTPGDYTLEVYWDAQGGSAADDCSETKFDSNNSANYTASFTVLCIDADDDGTCDDVDDCVGAYDDCGVCNGPGEIYDCGCSDIPEGDCDCNGNTPTAYRNCAGDCLQDSDGDGICDDVDTCVDSTAPVLTIPSNYTIQCDDPITYADASATDDCDSAPSIAVTTTVTPGNATGNYTITRSFVATDDAGNSSASQSQTITVQDTEAPSLSIPSDYTAECDDTLTYADASATDNCDNAPGIVVTSVTTQGNATGNYTIKRTFVASDDAGNSISKVQTITVQDTEAPSLTIPADYTAECDADLVYANATATDNCDSAPGILVTSQTIAGNATGNYTIERTFIATDDAGNSSVSQMQTITVQDTQAPSLTIPANYTADCDDTLTYADASATDNCDNAPGIVVTSVTTQGNATGNYTIERTFTATDDAGNSSVSQTQTITVQDLDAPTFTTLPSNGSSECAATGNTDGLTTWLANGAGAVATDNCGPVTITNNYGTEAGQVSLSDDCGNTGSVTVTFTATDDAGNTASQNATYTIVDTTAPSLSGTPEATVNVAYGSVPSAATVTATDACSGSAEVTMVETTIAGNCAHNYTVRRVWTATDACENSSSFTQNINVTDTTAPTILVGATSFAFDCDANNPADVQNVINTWLSTNGLSGFAIDNADTDLTWSHDYNEVTNGLSDGCGATGSVTVTFTVADDCGNTASTTATLTIEDNTAPTFDQETLPADATVECDDIPTAATLTASDECGTASVAMVETSAAGSCPNGYSITRTWTATDLCGNTTEHVQVLTVVDTTNPAIAQGNEAAAATVQCGTTAMTSFETWLNNHGGASATDNCTATGDLSWTHNYDATTNGFSDGCGASGAVTVIFTVTDECSNSTTTSATFTITDTTAPSFVQALPANDTVECDEVPTAPILTATDNCGTATVAYTETRTDGNCDYNYVLTRTWVATDECNLSTTHTQTITVQDTEAPVLNADITATVQLDADGNGSITAASLDNGTSDNCGTVTLSLAKTSFDCSDLGDNVVVFTATDQCSNSATQNVTITVEDNVAPVFTEEASDDEYECSGSNAAQLTAWLDDNGGAQATDNCTAVGSLTWTYTSTETATGFDVVFRVTDAEGNYSETSASFTIVDTTAPVLAGVPADITVACDAYDAYIAGLTAVTASDVCCETVTLVYAESSVASETCPHASVVTRTWTATDDSDNEVTATQVVTIVDNTDPTAAAKNITVELDAMGVVTITGSQVNDGSSDNCSAASDLTFSVSPSSFSCDDLGTNNVTLTVTDECGNFSTASAVVTVEDNAAPTIVAQTITVNLDEDGDAIINADDLDNGSYDNCTAAADLSFAIAPSEATVDCDDLGLHQVTLRVTDAENNYAETTLNVTVADVTDPEITTPAVSQTVECVANNATAFNTWLDDNGGAEATDACDSELTWTHNYGSDEGDVSFSDLCGPTGAVTVTFTATDDSGNSSSTTATYTIKDETKPVAAAKDIAVSLDADGNATISGADVDNGSSDSCSDVTLTVSPSTFDCTDIGPNTVTLTVTDACDNQETATAVVTVSDGTKPNVLTQNLPLDLAADGTLSITGEQINNGSTDACGIASYSVSPSTFNCTNVGENTVTLTVTDVNGNSETANATVTVNDVTPPTVLVQAYDLVLGADGTATLLSSNVNNGSSDACGIASYSLSKTAFDCADLGANTVTLTVEDNNGNESSTEVVVTVKDTTLPSVVGQNVTVTLDANGEGSVAFADMATEAGAEDNCTVVSTTLTDASGNAVAELDCADLGANTITLTVTDQSNNVYTTTATLTVVDATAPAIGTQAEDLTVECDGSGNTTELNAWLANNAGAAATDACSAVTWSHNYASLSLSDLCGATGAVTVTFTAKDASNNASTTSATFTIVDTVAPSITTVASGESVEYDGQDQTATLNTWLANHGGAVAADDCGTVSWTHNYTSLTAGCGVEESAEVTFRATDACGNYSETTATWSIVDNTPPTISFGGINMTAECNPGASPADNWLANHGFANAADDGSGLTWSNDYTGMTNGCGNTGSAMVTFTATDDCGNASTTSRILTISDTTAPTASADDITVDLDANGAASITTADINDGSSDTCGEVTLSLDITSFDCTDVGNNTVTLTVTDECGNESTATANVLVRDQVDPVACDAKPHREPRCFWQRFHHAS